MYLNIRKYISGKSSERLINDILNFGAIHDPVLREYMDELEINIGSRDGSEISMCVIGQSHIKVLERYCEILDSIISY